jgi:hypothetical protein
MTVRPVLSSCIVLWALSHVGCGGGSANEPTPGEPSSGGDLTSDEPAAERLAEASEPAPQLPTRTSGPAKLTLDAQVRGKSVPAKVRLIAADGSEAATGEAGHEVALQAGEYTLEVEITDDSVLIDKPTQKRQLVITPGDDLHEKAEFPWSMVTLNVRVNGKLDRAAKVVLMRDGKEVATMSSGAAPAPISPGRYEAVVQTRGARIDVKGMLFPEGGTENKPIDVRM